MIIDAPKNNVPTVPTDTVDPPRFAQPVETTKDAFILELRKFFDRQYQTTGKLEEVPTIRKYDVSFKPNEGSQETAVTLIQKFPDISEHLPLVAILGATGRNLPMGISGQKMATVHYPPLVECTNSEPFALADDQTIIYETSTPANEIHTSTILLRGSRFVNITQATAQEVVNEINFQSLYAHGVDNSGKVNLVYGGPSGAGATGNIKIIGGTAITALGFTIGQQALYKDMTPYHRYYQASQIDVAMEVVAEDYNERTELTDLLWSFFTYFLDSRQFTFLGRGIFDKNINEWYQVIINTSSVSMSGEQEVPRPGDEKDKLYVNRVTVTVTTIQYSDHAVVSGTTPIFIAEDSVLIDQTIPQKN